VAFPVVGLLLGGIYFVPARRLSGGREPWFTVLLGAGLAATVFGIGYLSQTRIVFSSAVWLASIALLLVERRIHGSLDGNLERFGHTHAIALVVTFFLAAVSADAARTHA